ncbi:MAG: hypothetical protein Q4B13_01915 [Lautropia sp.]|nr:hypothetical protein [Lautropia sp.]
MISVLIIAHQPLATALLGCCRHVYRALPVQAAALDIIPDEDPEQALREARSLASRINDGSGLVVLTDLYGATPSRIAVQMAVPGRVSVFYGVNLPMLLKVFNYRARMPLRELEFLVMRDAADGIGLVDLEPQGRRIGTIADGSSCAGER